VSLVEISYTEGTIAQGFNDSYEAYTVITPTISIKLISLQVQIRNPGGTWRGVTAKITDSTGEISLTGDSVSDTLRDETKWLTIDSFPTPPILESGVPYRIYLQGPDPWNSLQWLGQSWIWGDPKNYRLWGEIAS